MEGDLPRFLAHVPYFAARYAHQQIQGRWEDLLDPYSDYPFKTGQNPFKRERGFEISLPDKRQKTVGESRINKRQRRIDEFFRNVKPRRDRPKKRPNEGTPAPSAKKQKEDDVEPRSGGGGSLYKMKRFRSKRKRTVIRRRKRRGPKKYEVQTIVEHASVVTAFNATSMVDLGHYNFPITSVVRNVFKSFVIKLVRRIDREILNWTDSSSLAFTWFIGAGSATHEIGIEYSINASDAAGPVETVFPLINASAALNYMNLSDAFADAFITAIGSSVEDIRIHQVFYREVSSGTKLNTVGLQGSIVEVDVCGTMVMQNRTHGESANDEQSNDVTNNPLRYRKYCVVGNNILLDTNVGSSSSDNVANGVHGAINGFQNTVSGPFTDPRNMKYLKYSTTGLLLPGRFMRSMATNKYKMRLDNLFVKLLCCLRQTTLNSRIPLGTSCVFVFDKVLATGVGNQNVKVGWQILSTIRVSVYNSRPKLRRIFARV